VGRISIENVKPGFRGRVKIHDLQGSDEFSFRYACPNYGDPMVDSLGSAGCCAERLCLSEAGPCMNLFGDSLLENDENSEAIQAWRGSLRLQPNNARAHNNLGVALERSGKTKEALEEYGKAYQANPGDSTFQGNFKRLSAELNQPPAGSH
jgi:tetratricopeptide (TPR) repeat protein